MVERLLLDRIDAKAGGAPVGRKQNLIVLPRAHEAQAALPLMQLAIARAYVALDTAILQPMPIAAGHTLDGGLIHAQARVNSAAILYLGIWGAGEDEAMVEPGSSATKIRPPAAAGLFYAGDPLRLQATVSELLGSVPRSANVMPKALIAPHAGYVYSGRVAAQAFATLREAGQSITRVVLIGPAHFVPVRGIAAPTVDAFETPLGRVPVDRHALSAIADLPFVIAADAPHAPEHSLEVELPFLQALLPNFAVVPLVIGDAVPRDVAEVLRRLWDGPETLLVVSSDLSHYHDYDTARRLAAATAA